MPSPASLADYDRGYGHFTTRQNIQFNWPRLVDVPAILERLAEVEMHAIQTSGNCIRNVTSDPYAGVAVDEVEDPRITGEIIRQWSTFHPEFSFLPRKFKIAVIASEDDRAALAIHDIGVRARRRGNAAGYQIFVGGGQGRTPVLAPEIRDFLPRRELLGYLDAIMRVYNRHGRRDNKYKARIKILVRDMGAEAFTAEVEKEYAQVALEQPELQLTDAAWRRVAQHFESASPEPIPRAQENPSPRPRAARATLSGSAATQSKVGLRGGASRSSRSSPPEVSPAMPPPSRWTWWRISPIATRPTKSG